MSYPNDYLSTYKGLVSPGPSEATWTDWDVQHIGHSQYSGSNGRRAWKGCIDCSEQIVGSYELRLVPS